MLQEFKFQLSTAFLTVLTVAAMVAAALNFQQLHRFRLPDDGVIWVDRALDSVKQDSGKQNFGKSAKRTVEVVAYRVEKGGPADKKGLHEGDVLVRMNGQTVDSAETAAKMLAGVGPWNTVSYTVERGTVDRQVVDVDIEKVIVGEIAAGGEIYYQYPVGLAYLAIGLFIYLRRSSAPKAQEFYIFCLVSFIFCCFHYTGKLNAFDQAIYWGNTAAGLLAPTLFLHFCLTFPERKSWYKGWGQTALLAAPTAIFLAVMAAVSSGTLTFHEPLILVRMQLDRWWMALLTSLYLASGVVLELSWNSSDDPIVRQQLKWLRNGILWGFGPFALFYSIPFALGVTPTKQMALAVLTLPLIPLTLAWAIVRYRLMDVDVIFRRGYAYTLATVGVLACFYAVVFSLGSLVQKNFRELGNTGLLTVMLVTAFLFQPIRNWIQERLDKFFYRDSYDYRRTLIEFARELNSETDLDKMLQSVGDRLMQTLAIRYITFFLADDAGTGEESTFRLRKSMGSSGRPGHASMHHPSLHQDERLDLQFLNWPRTGSYLFFERTRYLVDAVSQSWPASVRHTIGALDLTYYLPCSVRGRIIAYLGVSRTETGVYLSSEDIELLQTLTGYVGIAIENATLYRALQQKVEDFERLKEFSENIVESINVGILAADLDDRVESWNTQMEELTGISRDSAVGRTLRELFSDGLAEQFDAAREQEGIQHIYKFVLTPEHMPLRTKAMAAAASDTKNESGNAPVNGGGNGLASASAASVNSLGISNPDQTKGYVPGELNGKVNGHGALVSGEREAASGLARSNESGSVDGTPPGGEEATVNIAIAPLVSKDNQQIGRLIIFDDITERSELERRLVQADKLSSIGLLAAGVAHEVNTPLAVISTYAQMLSKQVSGDEQKSRILEKIAKQTFRASEIVNSLLNFSRTAATESTDVNLNRVIQETISLIEHQLQKAGIEVRLQLAEPLPAVQGSAGKLQQVFLNLFLNARDAMEQMREQTGQAGVLEIATTSGENGIGVEVNDNGLGISPEYIARIYDPFFTTKAARKGTGLGLAVSYGIIQEHGGSIEVASRPGQGTQFRLEFPRVRSAVHA